MLYCAEAEDEIHHDCCDLYMYTNTQKHKNSPKQKVCFKNLITVLPCEKPWALAAQAPKIKGGWLHGRSA